MRSHFAGRPLAENERKQIARGYNLAVSVFMRTPTYEKGKITGFKNISPKERKAIVGKMLKNSVYVGYPKTHYLPHALGLSASIMRSKGLRGLPIAAIIIPAALRELADAEGQYLSSTDKISYHKNFFSPTRFKTSEKAAHEGIHFLGKSRLLRQNQRIQHDETLATSIMGLRAIKRDISPINLLLASANLPKEFQGDYNLYGKTGGENYAGGLHLGNYAAILGTTLGSQKAAYDYLALISRGMHHKTVENTIRRIYAEKAKAKSAAQGGARGNQK